jgi:hypothetical protein
VALVARPPAYAAGPGRSMTLQGDTYVQLFVSIEGYIDYINPYYIARTGGREQAEERAAVDESPPELGGRALHSSERALLTCWIGSGRGGGGWAISAEAVGHRVGLGAGFGMVLGSAKSRLLDHRAGA